MNKYRKSNAGFTLIELMIASFISIIILMGVLTLMGSNKRTYNMQADQADLQENARFALQFLGHGLRMGGYFGCTHQPVPGVWPAIGLDSGSDELFPGNYSTWSKPAQDSDVLMVASMETDRNAFRVVHCPRDPNSDYLRRTCYANDGITPLTPCPNPPGGRCQANVGTNGLSPPTPLQQGRSSFTMNGLDAVMGNINIDDTVVAADCVGSTVYTVDGVNPATRTVSITPPLARDYENGQVYYGAEMRRLSIQRFFISMNSEGGYSLFRDDAGGYNAAADPPSVIDDPPDMDTAEELVSGVESIQLRWGEDTNNDQVPDIYRRADQVVNWNDVVSVRVALLLQTPLRDIDPDTRTYQLDSDLDSFVPAEDMPNDARRRRLPVTQTFALHNNVLIAQ